MTSRVTRNDRPELGGGQAESEPPPSSVLPREGSPSWTHGIALLFVFGVAWVLSSAPRSVLTTVPLVYAALDGFGDAQHLPSWFMRLGARFAHSCLWGASLFLGTLGATHQTAGPSWPVMVMTLTLLAGTLLAPLASLNRGFGTRAPLVSLLDVLTTTWLLVLALLGQSAPTRWRLALTVAMALALIVRTAVLHRVRQTRPGADRTSPTHAAIGFVGWVGAGACACVLTATPWVLSGLGTAVVLTLSALWVERRRRRVNVFFLRASLAFCTATMLAAATWLCV